MQVPTKTRVVFLQHPRERYVAIGTARMAHLSLPNSELHLGIDFSDNNRVMELASQPGTAVLFPGEGAVDPSSFGENLPRNLVVVDGTWPQAKKVIERNPVLRSLPRVGLTPRKPGNYRIRKEPSLECLATIEAVVEVMGQLEGPPERFDPILGAFDYMVDRQIQSQAERVGPPRYKLHRQRNPRAPILPAKIAFRPEDWVVVYAESNAHPSPREPGGEPVHELLHLVARRVSNGARFESVLRPRTPLGDSTPHHVELEAARFEQGEPREAALARWREFLRPTDVLCGWGFFTLDVLRGEGVESPYEDVRNSAIRLLKRRPGGIEQAAELLGRTVSPWTVGRAGRRVAALEEVLSSLAAPREGYPSILHPR